MMLDDGEACGYDYLCLFIWFICMNIYIYIYVFIIMCTIIVCGSSKLEVTKCIPAKEKNTYHDHTTMLACMSMYGWSMINHQRPWPHIQASMYGCEWTQCIVISHNLSLSPLQDFPFWPNDCVQRWVVHTSGCYFMLFPSIQFTNQKQHHFGWFHLLSIVFGCLW